MQGKGIFRFENGDIYEGDFNDGKFHGNGKYNYTDGKSYDG